MSESPATSEPEGRPGDGGMRARGADGTRWRGIAGDARLRVLLLLLLGPFALSDLGSDALTHGDEAYWIAAGSRAAERILSGELFSPEWQLGATTSVLDLDHPVETAANRNPKLGTLLIGLSVHATGVPRPRTWTRDYSFGRSPEWNRRRGLLPSRATLLAGRLPAAALFVLGALAFFQVLRTQAGPGVSFLTTLLLATNPLVATHCRRAMLDGPAYAFSIAAILLAIRACERPARWGPALGTGLALGAAVASKPNAGILIPVLAAAFVLQAHRSWSRAWLARGALTAATAACVFFASNPTLYLAPIEGVLSMLRIGSELEGLQRLGGQFATLALPTFESRAAAAFELLVFDDGLFGARLGVPLDAVLLGLGAGVLALRARRDAAARVLLLWLGVALIAACVWPPMRWARYFLPAFAPVAVAEGAGLALALAGAGRGWQQLRGALARRRRVATDGARAQAQAERLQRCSMA